MYFSLILSLIKFNQTIAITLATGVSEIIINIALLLALTHYIILVYTKSVTCKHALEWMLEHHEEARDQNILHHR